MAPRRKKALQQGAQGKARDNGVASVCPPTVTSNLPSLRPEVRGPQWMSRMIARLEENTSKFTSKLDRLCLGVCCVKITMVCQRGRHHLLRFGDHWHAALSMMHITLLVHYILLSSMAQALCWAQLLQPLRTEPRARGVVASLAILAGFHLLFCVLECARESNPNSTSSVGPQLLLLEKSASAYGAVLFFNLSALKPLHKQLHGKGCAHCRSLLMLLRNSGLAVVMVAMAGSVLIPAVSIACSALGCEAPITLCMLSLATHLGAGSIWFKVASSPEGSSNVLGAALLSAVGR